MSKALEGAALIAAAVGMGAMAFADPALVASPLYDKIMFGLALGGISMEAGALANALTQNRGQNITTRQAAAYRQIIYGTQRVGGTFLYRSTTGSHKDQFNYVIVLATHECFGILDLFLDGRKVYWNVGSVGNGTQNGINFGGSANGNTYTGPNGVQYNFGGLVYCQAYYGTQTAQPNTVPGGGFDTGLQANDPVWGPSAQGIPYIAGCTYVYLKIEFDANTFPSEPEIRFTVLGKPVYDPRTQQTTYSSNWALIVNDVLTDPVYGLGDSSVNQAQLIAAANVCDEQVPLAAGGTEARYSAHWHYDTSTGVGDILSTFMSAAAGRLSRIGGEWYIWPAYYQGPSASFNESALIGPVQWEPKRPYRELFNRVTGTYTPPQYPYNVAGNAYDANGFYEGQIQDNFGYAFTPTNYPQYAEDTLHGYPADQWLAEDGGITLPKEISQACVLSVSQAQRLAKINLLRNRFQGSGTFEMSLAAFGLQPCDTFNQTFSYNGWQSKLLEVSSFAFKVENGTTPKITVSVGVNETDPSVYEWSASEELTPYDRPAVATQVPNIPAPPTNMQLVSSAATALIAPDGTVTPRIEVTWDTPLDGLVTTIQVQYQPAGGTAWTDAVAVDVDNNAAFISPVIAGTGYDVRIRSVRASGAVSSWEEIDGFTAGLVISVGTQSGIGIGSLVGEAFSDGTAGIVVEPFTAFLANRSVSYFPSTATLTGLTQQQSYWVYVVDPTLQGGDLTPIATLQQADYLGKNGYWLIDTVVTPYAATTAPGGTTPPSSQRYYPNAFTDGGTRTTTNPGYAFDGNLSTCAVVSGATTTVNSSSGYCTFSGWPSVILQSASTLTVVAAVTAAGDDNDCSVDAAIGSSSSNVFDLQETTAQATYTVGIPAGTNLNTVSVSVASSPGVDQSGNTEAVQAPQPGGPAGGNTYVPASIRASVYEVYVTT